LGLLVLALAGAAPAPARPGQQAPELAPNSDGTVVTRANRTLRARPGDATRLRPGDVVATSGKRAILRWPDGSRAALRPSSEIALSDSAGGGGALYLLLRRGDLAYSFAPGSALRVGFWSDAAQTPPQARTPLDATAGYLNFGAAGIPRYHR